MNGIGDRVTFEVTAGDIALGVPGEGRLCPVARAVRRGLEARGVKVGDVIVTGGYIEVWFDGEAMGAPDVSVMMPKSVSDFVMDFDDFGADAVTPFTFEFSVPFRLPVQA